MFFMLSVLTCVTGHGFRDLLVPVLCWLFLKISNNKTGTSCTCLSYRWGSSSKEGPIGELGRYRSFCNVDNQTLFTENPINIQY